MQMPMQAVGMAAQTAQPLMQGVQGIVQQATQAAGKSQDGMHPEGAGHGSQSGVDPADRAKSSTEERTNMSAEGNAKSENESEPDRESSEPMAGTGGGYGPQAPVSASEPEPLYPPRSRRITGTSPEVAL